MAPMKMPNISTPTRDQLMNVPFITTYEKILMVILSITASADVPATRNMGSPTTLVMNGTYRNPPPIPRNDEIAAIKNPPTNGRMGLKLNSVPKNVKLIFLKLSLVTRTRCSCSDTFSLMAFWKDCDASFDFLCPDCPRLVVL